MGLSRGVVGLGRVGAERRGWGGWLGSLWEELCGSRLAWPMPRFIKTGSLRIVSNCVLSLLSSASTYYRRGFFLG